MLRGGIRQAISIDFQTPREQAKRGEFHPDVHEELANSIAQKVKSMISTQKRGEKLADSMHAQKIQHALDTKPTTTIGKRVAMPPLSRAIDGLGMYSADLEVASCAASQDSPRKVAQSDCSMSPYSASGSSTPTSRSPSPIAQSPLQPIRTLARPSRKDSCLQYHRHTNVETPSSLRAMPTPTPHGRRILPRTNSDASDESVCLYSSSDDVPGRKSEQTMASEIEALEQMLHAKKNLLKEIACRRHSEHFALGRRPSGRARFNSWNPACPSSRISAVSPSHSVASPSALDRHPVTPASPLVACRGTPRRCTTPRRLAGNRCGGTLASTLSASRVRLHGSQPCVARATNVGCHEVRVRPEPVTNSHDTRGPELVKTSLAGTPALRNVITTNPRLQYLPPRTRVPVGPLMRSLSSQSSLLGKSLQVELTPTASPTVDSGAPTFRLNVPQLNKVTMGRQSKISTQARLPQMSLMMRTQPLAPSGCGIEPISEDHEMRK